MLLKSPLKNISNHSLKSLILTSFIFMLTVSMSILGIISYYATYKSYIGTGMANYSQLLNQLCSNIDLHFDEIRTITDSISNESRVKYSEGYFRTVKEQINGYAELKYVLFNEISKHSEIDDTNVYYQNGDIISSFNIYAKEDIKRVSDYYDIKDIYLTTKIVPLVLKNKAGVSVLSAVKSIYTPDESDYNKGFAVVNFSFDKLREMFTRLYLGENSHAFIVDKDGNIQFNCDKSMFLPADIKSLMTATKPAAEYSGIQKIQDSKYLISYKQLMDTDFYVLFCVPVSNLTVVSNRIGIITLIVFGCCIVLSIFLATRMSTIFTKPLIKLTKHMSEASEGNFTSVESIRGSYEIRILYEKFSEMITKIDRLIKENDEKNILKRKAELYALQAQINPHFLYNTLNSINSMAILMGARDIMKMTTSLANLFRSSINKRDEFITIAEELLHVKSYLDIQKIRYKEKFITRLDIDENITGCKIVKLILQPLVENSIYHGLEIKNGQGLITIKGYALKSKVILEITDNGVGIIKEELKDIRRQLRDGRTGITQSMEKRSVGIFNVNERIKLYYGEEYGLRISSKKNIGTRVRIFIPHEQWEGAK
jgi:two-component system, sensor histidine kinase YesM